MSEYISFLKKMYKILQALERPIYLNLLKRMVSEMGSGSNSTNKII